MVLCRVVGYVIMRSCDMVLCGFAWCAVSLVCFMLFDKFGALMFCFPMCSVVQYDLAVILFLN